jgi:hypothetical protein
LAVERIPPIIVSMGSMSFDRLLPDWQSESYVALPVPVDSLLWIRLVARLRSGHFDRLLAGGAAVDPGTPLAMRADRLVSIREREAVARVLRRCLADAHSGTPLMSPRMEVDGPEIVGAENIIDSITLRLHSPRPVSVRGMAMLRVLLTTGGSPLYRYGRGDLLGQLSEAFDAL